MVKKCPSCGYNNRDDAAFCSSCGASIGGTGTLPAPFLKPVPSVRVVTPVSMGGPVRVPAPGQCFYHPNLPAVFVCNRCGRSICRDDSKAYMDLVLCPQCYQSVVPMSPQPAPQPAPSYAPPMPTQLWTTTNACTQLWTTTTMMAPYPMYGMPSSPRALWGFILCHDCRNSGDS